MEASTEYNKMVAAMIMRFISSGNVSFKYSGCQLSEDLCPYTFGADILDIVAGTPPTLGFIVYYKMTTVPELPSGANKDLFSSFVLMKLTSDLKRRVFPFFSNDSEYYQNFAYKKVEGL